jgi:hypothetical protein
MTRAPSTEEPCAANVACTVLKASEGGDPFAEPNRALRPAVIWRRTSLGTQSALGSQFVARMLTVTLTLRLQQRSVLGYLTAACEAARQGMPIPSLLPDLSLSEQEHHFAIAA